MRSPVGWRERSSPEIREHQLNLVGGDPSGFTFSNPHLQEAAGAWWASHGRVAIATPSLVGVAGFASDLTVDDGTLLHRRLFLTVFQTDGVASKVLEAQPVRVERDDAGGIDVPTFYEQPFSTEVFEGLLAWGSMKPGGNFWVSSSDLPIDFVGHGHDRQTLAINPVTLLDPNIRLALKHRLM